MITRKRKNPILHEIGGIQYEIIDKPIYNAEELLNRFSEIINRKFKTIKNHLPLIVFKRLVARDGELRTNLIINSNYKNRNNKLLRTLFHELGHFIYRFYISDDAIEEFNFYIDKNTKKVDIQKLINLVNLYEWDEISKNYSLEYVLIGSLQFSDEYSYYTKNVKNAEDTNYSIHFLEWLKNIKVKLFDKPASAYMPNSEEIFCEIFANYMMYDLRLLHSENYRILRQILPELRS